MIECIASGVDIYICNLPFNNVSDFFHFCLTQDFSAGLDARDELINQMSVVLKMLYLWDFRELQTDLNALIVLGQEYTADPKTNASLGKVGR